MMRKLDLILTRLEIQLLTTECRFYKGQDKKEKRNGEG